MSSHSQLPMIEKLIPKIHGLYCDPQYSVNDTYISSSLNFNREKRLERTRSRLQHYREEFAKLQKLGKTHKNIKLQRRIKSLQDYEKQLVITDDEKMIEVIHFVIRNYVRSMPTVGPDAQYLGVGNIYRKRRTPVEKYIAALRKVL